MHRAHFNDSLNDMTAKISQRILTINSCNAYKHFEQGGHLSQRGYSAFWQEMDDLLDRYERNKVKLLPNPKNPPREATHHFDRRPDFYHRGHHRY